MARKSTMVAIPTTQPQGESKMRINVPKNASVPTPVPPGIYKVCVTGTKVRTSEKGNLCINPELTIQSQGPDESIKTIGRKVGDNWTMTENALSVWATAYKVLVGKELPEGEFEIDEFVARITSDVLNKECLVQLEIREDSNGVPRNQIKRYTALSL
jgi:hypothetical protein